MGLVVTELIDRKVLTWSEAIAKLSANPARIFNLAGRGTLKKGSIADITIIDPARKFTLSAGDLVSKSRNTPFTGRPLKGFPLMTIVGGKIAWPQSE